MPISSMARLSQTSDFLENSKPTEGRGWSSRYLNAKGSEHKNARRAQSSTNRIKEPTRPVSQQINNRFKLETKCAPRRAKSSNDIETPQFPKQKQSKLDESMFDISEEIPEKLSKQSEDNQVGDRFKTVPTQRMGRNKKESAKGHRIESKARLASSTKQQSGKIDESNKPPFEFSLRFKTVDTRKEREKLKSPSSRKVMKKVEAEGLTIPLSQKLKQIKNDFKLLHKSISQKLHQHQQTETIIDSTQSSTYDLCVCCRHLKEERLRLAEKQNSRKIGGGVEVEKPLSPRLLKKVDNRTDRTLRRSQIEEKLNLKNKKSLRSSSQESNKSKQSCSGSLPRKQLPVSANRKREKSPNTPTEKQTTKSLPQMTLRAIDLEPDRLEEPETMIAIVEGDKCATPSSLEHDVPIEKRASRIPIPIKRHSCTGTEKIKDEPEAVEIKPPSVEEVQVVEDIVECHVDNQGPFIKEEECNIEPEAEQLNNVENISNYSQTLPEANFNVYQSTQDESAAISESSSAEDIIHKTCEHYKKKSCFSECIQMGSPNNIRKRSSSYRNTKCAFSHSNHNQPSVAATLLRMRREEACRKLIGERRCSNIDNCNCVVCRCSNPPMLPDTPEKKEDEYTADSLDNLEIVEAVEPVLAIEPTLNQDDFYETDSTDEKARRDDVCGVDADDETNEEDMAIIDELQNKSIPSQISDLKGKTLPKRANQQIVTTIFENIPSDAVALRPSVNASFVIPRHLCRFRYGDEQTNGNVSNPDRQDVKELLNSSNCLFTSCFGTRVDNNVGSYDFKQQMLKDRLLETQFAADIQDCSLLDIVRDVFSLGRTLISAIIRLS